jgi:hypothetical protein
MQCGATYSGILHVKLPFQDSIMCDEQLSHPIRSVDRLGYLPKLARMQ